MSGTSVISMGDRGRVVIPSDVRERLGLVRDTPLVLLETPDGLVLMTRDQLRKRVQGELAGVDLVSELLNGRRAAAAREDEGRAQSRGSGDAWHASGGLGQ